MIIFKNFGLSTFVFEARVTDREGRVNGSLLLAISLPESLSTALMRNKIKDTLISSLWSLLCLRSQNILDTCKGMLKLRRNRTPMMYFTTENFCGFLFVLGCDLIVFKDV